MLSHRGTPTRLKRPTTPLFKVISWILRDRTLAYALITHLPFYSFGWNARLHRCIPLAASPSRRTKRNLNAYFHVSWCISVELSVASRRKDVNCIALGPHAFPASLHSNIRMNVVRNRQWRTISPRSCREPWLECIERKHALNSINLNYLSLSLRN